MALRLIEGFESFGANGTTGTTLDDAVKAKYADSNTDFGSPDCLLNDGWGSGLGFQMQYESSGNNNYIVAPFDDQDTWLVGFAIKRPSGDLYGDDELVSILTTGGASTINLTLTEEGRLRLSTGVSTYYATRTLKSDTWYYIEFKVYIHNSAGTIDLNINGVSDRSETSQDTLYTAYSTLSQVRFHLNHTADMIIDDIYVADGTAGVNTFLGPCKVEAIRPDADDTVAWDMSTGGDRYALVNTQDVNEVTYVEGDTNTESDLYTYDNLSIITGDVFGVQLNTGGKLTEAGTRQLNDRLLSNVTNSNGSTVLADTTGEMVYRVIEQDPDTAANWIVSGVNAIKAGVVVGD